jgi:hypothetical protein
MDENICNILMLCTILSVGAGLFTALFIGAIAFIDFLSD